MVREHLPAASVVAFNERLGSGHASKKTKHAANHLWAKTFLLEFFKRSPLVRQQMSEASQLEGNVSAGNLNVADVAIQRNQQFASDPNGRVQQAAALGGSRVGVDDANTASRRVANALSDRSNSPPRDLPPVAAPVADPMMAVVRRGQLPDASESHKRKADEALDLAFAREKVAKTRELIELFEKGAELLNRWGQLTVADTQYFGREVRNAIMLGSSPARNELLAAPTAPPSQPDGPIIATGTAVAAPAARPLPDNPFPWTAVMRAQHLNQAYRCADRDGESRLGRAVSDACLRATGMRPSQLNQGKLPQQAADGQARPTNFFTEAQAREWADPAIHAFFASCSSARPSH